MSKLSRERDTREKRALSDPTTYPPAKLKSELAKVREESDAICQAFIDSGRGYEKPSETRLLSDPLAQRWKANAIKLDSLKGEYDRRMTYHGDLRRTPQT